MANLRLALIWTSLPFLSLTAFPLSVTVRPLEPSPRPVGEVVRWIAEVADAPAGPLWYRFRSREAGQPWRTVVDFGPNSTLDWTESDHEGNYEVEVAVRRPGSPDAVTATAAMRLSPRTTDLPVITRTRNPLVHLYSAPPCPDGNSMRVTIAAADGSAASATPAKPCTAGRSMNFYLAGTKQYSTYSVQHTIETRDGGVVMRGPQLTLNVGSVSPFLVLPPYRLLTGSPRRAHGFVMHGALFTPTVITDLAGNLVWYYDGDITALTRPVGDGRFWGLIQPPGQPPETQMIREFDLGSVTTAETNAACVSEQLVARKLRPITAFHHEATRLPDGRVLVLAASEAWVPDLNSSGKTPVIGDTILLLDRDLQVVWAWDSFEHMDVRKLPTLGEWCTPVGAGCPSFSIAPEASDWLHGNSLQVAPDGSIIYSSRHLDQVLKIDFANGRGSGKVIWALGQGGDFRLASGSSADWFSHQHDPALLGDGKTLIVYDNGNVRRTTDPRANSRGQVYELDEAGRVATLTLNADLGVYAPAVGSAQLLPGGSYHFSSGFVPSPAGLVTRIAETDSLGRIAFEAEIGAATYRTFRLPDLYSRQ